MIKPNPKRLNLRVVQGGREALERAALEALIFDEARYLALKQRLFDTPPAALRAVQLQVAKP